MSLGSMERHDIRCDIFTVDGICTCESRLEVPTRIGGRCAFRCKCQTETMKEEDASSTKSGTDGETRDGTVNERTVAMALGIAMPSVQQEIQSYLFRLKPTPEERETIEKTLKSWLNYQADQALGSYLCSTGRSKEGSKLLEKSFTIPSRRDEKIKPPKNFVSQVNEECDK